MQPLWAPGERENLLRLTYETCVHASSVQRWSIGPFTNPATSLSTAVNTWVDFDTGNYEPHEYIVWARPKLEQALCKLGQPNRSDPEVWHKLRFSTTRAAAYLRHEVDVQRAIDAWLRAKTPEQHDALIRMYEERSDS